MLVVELKSEMEQKQRGDQNNEGRETTLYLNEFCIQPLPAANSLAYCILVTLALRVQNWMFQTIFLETKQRGECCMALSRALIAI